MATIARTPLDFSQSDPWRAVARQSIAWAADAAVELRDAVVLVPFAQHLPLARTAWAEAGGWVPRIETTRTLARSLGPPHEPAAGEFRFDPALDRLAARRLLTRHDWARAWSRRDPRGFDRGVRDLVATTQAFARRRDQLAPDEREAAAERWRELLTPVAGPGGFERALAALALEWAQDCAPAPTDRLFTLAPPAWIVVQAGGADALASALLERDGGLCIDSDVPLDDPFGASAVPLAAAADVQLAACADLEDEAQRSAAQVLRHLADGVQPVALIALDRQLVRRVRALLARRGVPIQDETGWTLSTTRAAATLVALLRAASPQASTDDRLDWLKTCATAWPGRRGSALALQAIESKARRHGWARVAQVDPSVLGPAASALWADADALLRTLADGPPRSLSDGLAALRTALQGCGAWSLLAGDEAGRQVLAALHLVGETVGDIRSDAGGQAIAPAPGPGGAPDDRLDAAEFAAWVDAALDDGLFVPAPPGQTPAVVVTPLERAMLRPFGAVVMPAADAVRLGQAPAADGLLSDALCRALGLPDGAQRRDAQTLAFAQVLRRAPVTLHWRRDDAGEPMTPSPLVERLSLALARHARTLPDAGDARVASPVKALPVLPPQPRAPSLLPGRLSASACEALRACPYRFHALRMLGLAEADELSSDIEKRDYGTWLHAVLQRFHAGRAGAVARTPEDDARRLAAAAEDIRREMALDAAAFLPFAASFERLVPRYVDWLQQRDRAGAVWLDAEVELNADPPGWGGVRMHGVIDRIDRLDSDADSDADAGDAGPVTELIDYKTGSAAALREQVRDPQEDTQLAFYAALLLEQPAADGPVAAAYLPLDESGALKAITHPDVALTARRLVDGIGRDLQRLRAGAALPALGEGSLCDHCEVRGLCRRDHWAEAPR